MIKISNKIAIFLIFMLCFSFSSNGKVNDFFGKKKQSFAQKQKEQPLKRKDTNLRDVQVKFNNSSANDNTMRFKWSSQKTFKVKMRLRIKTLIVLPEDEVIKAYTIGDNKSFKVSSISADFKNMVDVQSFYAGVDTNLTIIGRTGRIYNFYLRSYGVQSKMLPDFTIYVDAPSLSPQKSAQFLSDVGRDGARLSRRDKIIRKITAENDYLRNLEEGEEIFIDYKMYGDKEIAPYSAYDDGKWTYFDFRGQGIVESGRMPVIYKVIDGFDAIVNTRFEGGFIIAESINQGWTLKNGQKTVCVKTKNKKKFNSRFDKRR